MRRLSANEIEKLLGSISILNSSVKPQTLPKRTIKAVTNIIPNFGSAFDLITSDGKFVAKTHWHEPVEAITDESFTVLQEFLSEHPLYEHATEKRIGVKRNTDVATVAEFESTNLFNEFYRQLDATYQIHTIIPVDDEAIMACSLSRDKQDFTDEEKQMLEIFSPHLSDAVSNSNAFDAMANERSTMDSLLDKLQSGAIVFDEFGKIIHITSVARKLTSNYFSEDSIDGRGIPETLRIWMDDHKFRQKDEASLNQLNSFTTEKGGDQLRVRLIIENRNRRKTLLLQEKRSVTISQVMNLGLTPRESEILILMSKGKTNPEIAILLDISPRTVQKHSANIYEKLGVESRTAASLRVHELH